MIEPKSLIQVLTPHIFVGDGAAAIDFYHRAFEAQLTSSQSEPDQDGVLHCCLQVGSSPLMLGVNGKENGGDSSMMLDLLVEDGHLVHHRSLALGATELSPVTDQGHGYRSSKIRDPFGHVWCIRAPVAKMTHEEMQRAAEETAAHEA